MRNRIKEWREIRGLTQEQLAAMIAPPTTSVTVSRLENGKMGLSQKWIVLISEALEVTPSDLVANDTEEPPIYTFKRCDETHLYTPTKGSWLEKTSLEEHQFFYIIDSDALTAKDVPKGAIVIADFSADAISEARASENLSLVFLEYRYDKSDYSKRIIVPRLFIPPHTAIRNSNDLQVEAILINDINVNIVAIITTVIRYT